MHEHAREVAERYAKRHRGAGRLLRELVDVVDVVLEDLDAARHVAVEQERLGEPERVVLRERPGLQRHRQAFAAAQKFERLERELAEEAFELRDAGAERELVAVLFLQLQPDVDLVRLVRGLLDVDVSRLAVLERLEVPELVEQLDARLERLGVEDAVFHQAHLAPDDGVVRGRVADERDAVDEVLLPFLQPQRHVDDRRPAGRRRERLRGLRLGRIRIVAELVVRESP